MNELPKNWSGHRYARSTVGDLRSLISDISDDTPLVFLNATSIRISKIAPCDLSETDTYDQTGSDYLPLILGNDIVHIE